MHTRSSRSGVRRILWILAAVAMIMAVMPLAGSAANDVTVVDMIADGGGDSTTWVDVGDVTVTDNGTDLSIEFQIFDSGGSDWCITQTQVDVAQILVSTKDTDGIAQTKKGVPIPGQFEVKAVHDCLKSVPVTISIADLEEPFVVAVHADVTDMNDPVAELPVDMEALAEGLPDTATLAVTWYNLPTSYFDATISDAGVLDGENYVSWCVDVQRHIAGGEHVVNVFSSYEDLPGPSDDPLYAGTVDYPEHLPMVNWLINNMNVGTVIEGLGTVTAYDVANTIWKLVDNTPYTWGGLSARVPVMYDAAMLNGEGFVPGCNDVIAIILATDAYTTQSTIIQTTFVELGIECEYEYRGETAWAGIWSEELNTGDNPGYFREIFDGKTWAGYFTYPEPLTFD